MPKHLRVSVRDYLLTLMMAGKKEEKKMTIKEIVSMTAEQFKEAPFEKRIDALTEMTSRIQFQKEWLLNHSAMDKRSREYRMHKKFLEKDWNKIREWMNGIGCENPFTM